MHARFRSLAVATVVAMLSLVAVVPAQGQAAWSTPSFVRSMGGTGRAGLYAWGLAYNPVSNEVIVSDYMNFRVRRFSRDGVHLGDLPKVGGETWSVATDPNNGDIYVADNWNKQVHRYDVNGNHLLTFSVSRARYAAWIDIDHNGKLWIVDSADWSNATNVRLHRYAANGTHEFSKQLLVPYPNVPTLYGIHVAANGLIYTPDGNNGVIHVWNTSANHVMSFGSGGDGPGLLSGDIRGMAVDEANGWLFVSDSNGNEIEQFRLDGTYIRTFGSTGTGLGGLNAPRQLSVDPGGDVWVAEYGNLRFQRFTSSGTPVATYPDPSWAPPVGHLGYAHDLSVDAATGDVWVADWANQRVQRLRADGSSAGTWGRRGSGDHGFNYPSAVGFDPVLRRVWVANEEGRYIKVYDENMNYLMILGQQAKTPEDRGYLKNPTDIDFYDGKAFIGDEQHHSIKVLDATTGQELYQFRTRPGDGWSGNHGLGIDPATGNVYVANYQDDRIYVHAADGTKLFQFGSSGSANGQFTDPRDAVVIGNVLYVVDAGLSRIQAFTLDGTFLGKWGGWGDNAYQFRNPAGLDTDAQGRLYVMDMSNDRITVFDPATPRPAYSWSRPTVTLTSPADGQVLSAGPAVFTGTASDPDGIANVEIAIQRNDTGWWWDGRTSSWQAARTYNLARIIAATAPATTVDYSWTMPVIQHGESFRVEVVSRDRNNSASNPVAASYSLAPRTIVDTAPPSITTTSPVNGATVPSTEPVAFRGTATDDTGVAAAMIAIQDQTTKQWWHTSGTWRTSFSWVPATLDVPGATSTGWRFDWTAPADRRYGFLARVDDRVGNITKTTWATFDVVTPTTDTTPPDGTVIVPVNRQTTTAGTPFQMRGTATDDVGVATVLIAIRDTTTGLWWRANGTWGGWDQHAATLSAPGAATTEWTFSWTPPAAGSYGILVRTDDLAGNTDPAKPWVTFTAETVP